ncbi:hypothetical protein PUNSTDRAFT_130833 [Punctularia strigosozonata HHB-11173 SS5]|uniref:uncharacterized protein n=1 Tax=Punctularia strigosozonata (strain HHB-11173) TaxID=741275 RepID=UPI0004418306|nr:uncharacterized protein PUNSTDRAFT_130833 [Punctularia strigosozonata HHB-11173 SS5]EIN12576.1 hypothetical protein PUNSTDRAFT_130833 [Punctularia strigosozonata HHB-11173 SS5]
MLDSVRYVTSKDGIKICTYSAGNPYKPAVVFIPGFCCTALAFVKQFDDSNLLTHLHVIAYDIRGQGRSDTPAEESAYVSQRHAEDFKAVYDAYNLHKPFVSGWSLGAIVPTDIATYYGADLMAGVIITGGFPYRSMHPEVAHPTIMSIVPDLVSDDIAVFSKACEVFVESCFAEPARDLPYDTKLAWIGGVTAMVPAARRHIIMRTQDESAILTTRNTLPYLILQGDKDNHVVWENLQRFMEETFERSEFVLLRSAGHAPFFEQPQEVNQAILNFHAAHARRHHTRVDRAWFANAINISMGLLKERLLPQPENSYRVLSTHQCLPRSRPAYRGHHRRGPYFRLAERPLDAGARYHIERYIGKPSRPFPPLYSAVCAALTVDPDDTTLGNGPGHASEPAAWHLDLSIHSYRKAVALFAHHDDDRLYSLANLGNSLHHRYRLSKNVDDAEEAVRVFHIAFEECPEGHDLRPYIINSLDCTFLDICHWMLHMFHHQPAKNIDFLNEATVLAREALRVFSYIDSGGRLRWLLRLAHMRQTMFSHTGDPNIIDQAMRLSTEALTLTPPGHPRRADALTTMASIMCLQFDHLDRPPTLEDLQPVDHAARLLEEVLRHRPEGHKSRGDALTFLAVVAKHRLDIVSTGAQDRRELLSIRKEALEACPPGHMQRHQALYCLALDIVEPSSFTPTEEDLELAMRCSMEAMAIMQDGHPARFMAHYCLSCLYLRRGDYTTSIAHLIAMIDDSLGNVKDRVACSMPVISELQKRFMSPDADVQHEAVDALLEVYSRVLRLPPRMAFRAASIQTRLRQVTTWETLARDAAVTALSVGRPELAIEYLEQGRASFWKQSLHLREDFDQLPEGMSRDLLQLSRALEEGSFRHDQPEFARQCLSEKFDTLVMEARRLPGMDRFLMGYSFEELARTAETSRAHVIMLVPGARDGCHAIVIGQDRSCKWVPLPGITAQELGKHAVSFKQANISYRKELRQRDRPFNVRLMVKKKAKKPREGGNIVLTQLWNAVVQPIVAALGLVRAAGRDRPRVMWIPTGVFAFVPVHAAGLYGEDKAESCADYLVSSYAPTLSSLRTAQKKLKPIPRDTTKILLAAAPSPYDPEWQPLPYTAHELSEINSVVPRDAFICLPLEDDASNGGECGARVRTVLEELPNATILHLACHGYQDSKNPLASGFLLRDEMLTIAKLMPTSLPNAFLAFLSACETAKGDASRPDQAVHLAAAMLFTGFKSVIATLWSMGDVDGPLVARTVYEELFRGDSEFLDPHIVPYALDAAVQKLREIDPTPSRWAPYIHIGC